MNFPAISGITAIQQPTLNNLAPLRGIGDLSAPRGIGDRYTHELEFLRGAGQSLGLRVPDDTPFENILQAYLGLVNQAGRLEGQAHNLQVEYALGNHDDMLAVILAQEMAYTSLHFTVQVTNRVIEAYREIMRMQI